MFYLYFRVIMMVIQIHGIVIIIMMVRMIYLKTLDLQVRLLTLRLIIMVRLQEY